MVCAASEAVDVEATVHQHHQSGPANEHDVVADDGDHQGHHHHGGHHDHACVTCASCCVGAVPPVVPAFFAAADPAQFPVPLPPAASVVSFLTGGIERPPRSILV
ncbi:hypothetical protein [Paraburkholderia sp. HP33-1]|uniref:hypothetical protein n=1 Tax=Paraburkholderia sp. HP33-1 TaxID=2883243 RepID=UPI002DD440DE|nr:hypothetical protein [Paraburkholderia sp. HP33-1]